MTPIKDNRYPQDLGDVDKAKPLIEAALQLHGAEMCLRAMARLLRDMAPDNEFEHKLAHLARARIIGAVEEAEASL